jgi:glycolate oxidase
MYKKITTDIKERVAKIVGQGNVIFDPEMMLNYSHDEFSLSEIARMPELVVKPKKTEEIQEIMRLANEEMIPVTPRGGATGLCGGCVPFYGGMVLSFENMNQIIEIDLNNQMAVVEAGVLLSDFYSAVEEAGLFFHPHPGEESAMIGGLIATNAGGSRAVKYGVIRNHVRGLKVVLPMGSVIHPGGKLMKSSTGYNLLNLFIGSEGTLGIITQATIQLMPPSQVTRSLIIPYDELESAIETVPLLMRRKILPMAVEFIEREVIQIAEDFLRKKWPCSQGKTYLLIILDASSKEEIDSLSEKVAGICLENGALDVFVADSPEKQRQVLDIRSKIYEALKANVVEILDIAVPRAEIAAHVKKVYEASLKYGIWLPTYGHAADGNVHTHIMKVRLEKGTIIPLPEKEWRERTDKVREELYQDCMNRGGVISGEHGIGIVKKPYLHYALGEDEIRLMKGIKQLFDPNHILNPGKIFDE